MIISERGSERQETLKNLWTKKTGISQTAFSNWKAGRSEPSVDSLKKLADYFGVSIEYFLEGKEQQ